VLNEGQIIERGTHDELLAKQGFYYHLYMSHFRREVDEEGQEGGPEGEEEAPADKFLVPTDYKSRTRERPTMAAYMGPNCS